MADIQYFTGARAALLIDGEEVGNAVDVSGGENIERVPVNVLNNIRVKRFEPVGYTTTLRASKVYLFTEELKAKGWFPQPGANPQEHLRNILARESMTIAVVDSINGETFWQAEQVDIASHSFSFGARDIVIEDVEFTVIVARAAIDFTT